MRKVPERKIVKSLCKTHRNISYGGVFWNRVALDLLKLNYFKQKVKDIKEEREK